MSSPPLSRRGFIRASAAGAAALPLLSAACGVQLLPSTATPTPTPSGGVATTSSSIYPTYVPVAGGAKPDFPSAGPEYEDGYSLYPANPAKAWLKDPPGSGSTVSAFTMRLSGLPNTPLDQNPAWQEVNRQLNANVTFNAPLSADYPARLGTIMAGNDLPDIILFNGGLSGGGVPGAVGVPNLPQFLEQSMADLTPYLSGDAIKDYPFLAAIPPFAWKNSGCAFNGKLYMWPLERYLPGTAFMRNVDLWDSEIGPGYVPTNADDFKRILLQFTSPNDGKYGIGGSAGVISGGAVGIASVLRMFPSIFGAPNNWRADSAGLVKDLETPEYKEAVGYLHDLVAAGVFFPDTLTNPSGPTTASFPSGKAGLTLVSFGVTWTSMWTAMQAIKPVVSFLPLPPFPGHAGAKPVHYLGPGFLVTLGTKKASADRIKEILRIVDWLTAPFGSAEDFLLTYGVPEVDHTLNADGRPVTTSRTNADVDAVGWKYISQRPQVMTWPNWPDYAKIAYDFEHAVIPVGISDPTLGYVSQTSFAKGVPLNQTFTDGAADIVLGRRPLSDYDQLVKDWQTNGGNQIRTELRQSMGT